MYGGRPEVSIRVYGSHFQKVLKASTTSDECTSSSGINDPTTISEGMPFDVMCPEMVETSDTVLERRLCGTCLTGGRRMLRIGAFADIFTLLGSTANALIDTQAATEIEVCFECHYLLRRIDKFRTQVVSVVMLLQSLDIMSEKNDYSLSSLTHSRVRVKEDYTLQHGADLVKNDNVELEVKPLPHGHDSEPDIDSWYLSAYRSKRTDKMTCQDDLEDVKPRIKKRVARSRSGKSKVSRSKRIKGEKVVTMEMTEAEMQRSREEMRGSEQYRDSTYRCEGCVTGFSSEETLQKHERAKHSDEAGSFRCDICSIRCRTQESLWAHRKTHYFLYACLCGFTLRSLHGVLQHYRATHAPKNKFPCKTCGKEFLTERKLRYHRECEHKEGQECTYCGKEFNNSSTFNRRLLQHTAMPMYPCSICKKSYRGTFGLRAHMRTHSSQATEDAFCAECNVQFKNKYLYRHHLKTSVKHVQPDNFRFPCSVCDKRFFVASQLKLHEDTVHFKRTSFRCHYCDKGFATSYRVGTHIKNVHERQPVVKKHICDTCGRAFATKQQVLRHQPVHTGERKFSCGVCGTKFRQSAALYTHTKLVHRNKE